MEDKNLVWEAAELNLTESKKAGSMRISGTALATGRSRNGVNYRFKNLEENNGTEFNFIVAHRSDYDNPDHNVGEGLYSLENNQLKFDGTISNNAHHPDIVEAVKKGLVSVSIHGGFKSARVENGERVVEGLRIPLLALVNKHARGVPAASIEAALEEKLNMREVRQEEQNKTTEVKNMSEQKQEVKESSETVVEMKAKLALKEAEEQVAKAEARAKEAEEKLAAQKKETLVDSIMELNKDFKKEELLEKSEEALETMHTYEKKLAESEEQKDEGEGASQVEEEGKEEKEEKTEESLKGIDYDEKSGNVGFTEEGYKAFSKEIRESVYGK